MLLTIIMVHDPIIVSVVSHFPDVFSKGVWPEIYQLDDLELNE